MATRGNRSEALRSRSPAPSGKTAAVVALKHIDDAFVVGLVKCYKYSLHMVDDYSKGLLFLYFVITNHVLS